MPYEGCAMDTTTNTFRGDFVLVHEYDPTKELIKFPEGSSVYPTKMHEEVAKLAARLDDLEQKYQAIQTYVQSDDFIEKLGKRQLQQIRMRTGVR